MTSWVYTVDQDICLMWTEEMYQECLSYFRKRASDGDSMAEAWVWLLEHVGFIGMYEDVPVFNRVIEVVLTQRISFKKSGIMKKRLSALMGTREYTPQALMEFIDTRDDSLKDIGIDEKIQRVCRDICVFTLNRLKNADNELTLKDIEDIPNHISGFSFWSVNVSCINLTFSKRVKDRPYNALTNRDPVIKRGFYWLTGIEPYGAILDKVSNMYSPYAGIINRYIWEAFNYHRIPVKLPSHYKKWANKGTTKQIRGVPQRLSYVAAV